MTHARRLGSMIALACLAPACLLDPMSSGELDRDTTAGATDGGADGDTFDPGATSSPAGNDDGLGSSGGDETGDAPDAMQWSDIVGTPTVDTHACDVALDPTGRVAVAWFIDASPAMPSGRTGIRVYAPDGSESEAIEADGEVIGALAFASDGTLRVRGGTRVDDVVTLDFVRAYDAGLHETWSEPYLEKHGWGGCGQGWRGLVVDPTDHVVTYEYTCGGNGPCPQTMIRRHAPDGTLLWERNPSGNPGVDDTPLAVGPDGSIFDGSVLSWDDYDEVEIRKHDADGTELWMTTILGQVYGLWAAADGGAWVLTSSASGVEIHRLDDDGDVVATTASPEARVIGPTSDDSGFFAIGEGELQRRSLDMQLEWSIPLAHTPVSAAAVAADHRFAFTGHHAGGGNNYWVASVALP